MALTSPGVEVTVIDQSQYLPAAPGSVPFVLIATAQDKADPNGAGIAQGTTAANANKLYQVTSQRDLVTLFGNPTFYTTTNGTPIQGYELNEYGLLAAYSVLGVTNRCYVLRADVDLASLIGQTGRPVGAPANGTYWLDTTTTTWGIYEFNSATGSFVLQNPIVITDSTDLLAGVPRQTIGQQGDYAVVAISQSDIAPALGKQFFYKATTNDWVTIGSDDWLLDWPSVQGTESNPELTAGDIINLDMNGEVIIQITVPDDGGGIGSVEGVRDEINNLGWGYLSSEVRNGQLCIFNSYPELATPVYINLTNNGGGTALDDMGIDEGNYYNTKVVWGTSAQQPVWQQGQTFPRPTGSVWFKVGGNGVAPIMEEYDSTIQDFVTKNVVLSTSDWAVTETLDPTGGSAIPAGTIYGQYNFNQSYLPTSPLYFWKRSVTGPTVITGTNTSPVFDLSNTFTLSSVAITGTGGTFSCAASTQPLYVDQEIVISGTLTGSGTITGYTNPKTYYVIATNGTTSFTLSASLGGGAITTTAGTTAGLTFTADPFISTPFNLQVYVSLPSSATLSGPYSVTIQDGDDANDFVVAWSAAAIPNTTAVVTTSGALQITHTLGGVIVMNDIITSPGQDQGFSYGILTEAGIIANTTDGVKFGSVVTLNFVDIPQTSSSAAGTGAEFSVTINNGRYIVDATDIGNGGGSGYVVGELITIDGSALGGVTGTNDLDIKVAEIGGSNEVTAVQFSSGTPAIRYNVNCSNWIEFAYEANEGAPVANPENNANWFYSVVDEVDIMVNYNGAWKGYKNQAYDSNGFPTPTGVNATDPAGPIVSASEPTLQSDETALVYGDLWIDTSNLENYPVIYRWQLVNGDAQWVLIDNTDQTDPSGVLFADARWATNGTTSVTNDPIPTIVSLLTSNYLDLDAPNDALYPTGMLLFNTRRSGYNVKQFKENYFSAANFPDESLPVERNAWVTVSGNMDNGAPYMGRKAQRAMVVQALRSAIDTNTDIRDEDNFFNLQACPNYPELQPNMIVLNADRGETSYILGDTPLGLSDSATAIQAWATNAAGAASTGEDGLVTRNTYMGLFYPSGRASDLSGNLVAVPASHMMLRTFVRNDTIAYPWLAAAGTRRGIIDNASSIGYVNRQTGEFVSIKTRIGIRDTLYENFINPLVFFTGQGLLNYGNKTSFNSQSALDRTNVARLVAYIRRQLTLAGRPYVFEPNDAFTRGQIKNTCESLMLDLVAKRGVFDYLVVCDESNNTPERIDRNELWVDIAIEPVKAVEFIYIPVRILNTGELSGA